MKRLDWPLLAVFLLGPIQWVTLANVGLALKPVHLALLWAGVEGFRRLPQVSARLAPPPALIVFALAFLAYVGMLTASLSWTAETGDGASFIAKQIVYSLGALGLALHAAAISREKLIHTLRIAPLVSAGFFLLVATVVLQSRGISLFAVVGMALKTANPTLLQFAIFLNLFNDPAALASGEHTAPALRHTALAFILAAMVGCAATYASHVRAGGFVRLIMVSGMILGAAVVLLSVSRSLIVAMLLAGGYLIAAGLLRGPRMTLPRLLGLAALLFGSVVFSLSAESVFAILGQRFANLGDDGRLAMYAASLDVIAAAPFLGHGVGHEVVTHAKAHQVHNLFLSAWLQTGVPGLLAALTYIAALIVLMVQTLLRSRVDPFVGALGSLLALPLLRSQISGEGGSFTLAEWCCISILAGSVVLSREAVRSRRAPQPGNWPAPA